jgi:hypothetical protein
LNYDFLTTISAIDPYRDTNCQKLADYLQGGLNWAIAQYDLGEAVAIPTLPIIPPLGDAITYNLDTTKDLAIGLYCGFSGIKGALQVTDIIDATTALFTNITIDPISIAPNTPLLTKLVVCRDTRSYDAVNIDNSCYPLIKVFRTKEEIDFSSVVDVDLTIGYMMLLPDTDKLPGMMHWVARHLDTLLNFWSQVDTNCPFRILPDREPLNIEYRIMVDNLQNPVYTYLRCTLKAQEVGTS